MVGIRMFEQFFKEGLGWWSGLARVCLEFDIETRNVKIAACLDGAGMIFCESIHQDQLLVGESCDLYTLFSAVGKRAALCMNEWSDQRFGYVPNKAR